MLDVAPSVSAAEPIASKPVVSVKGVTHRYGAALALDNVSLDLPAGCMVGLIGPDGVGKSRLLALIAGARRIQQGQVEVLGGDMADARLSPDGLPAHRLHAAGAGQEPLPDAVGLREHRLLRPAVRPSRAEAQAPHRRAAGQHRAGALPRPAGRQAVRRHEAEALPVLRADPRPGPA